MEKSKKNTSRRTGPVRYTRTYIIHTYVYVERECRAVRFLSGNRKPKGCYVCIYIFFSAHNRRNIIIKNIHIYIHRRPAVYQRGGLEGSEKEWRGGVGGGGRAPQKSRVFLRNDEHLIR